MNLRRLFVGLAVGMDSLSTDGMVHNIRPLEPEKPHSLGNTLFFSTPTDSTSGGSNPNHLLTQCQGVILSALCEASGLAGNESPSPSGDGVTNTLAPTKGAFQLSLIGSRGSGELTLLSVCVC